MERKVQKTTYEFWENGETIENINGYFSRYVDRESVVLALKSNRMYFRLGKIVRKKGEPEQTYQFTYDIDDYQDGMIEVVIPRTLLRSLDRDALAVDSLCHNVIDVYESKGFWGKVNYKLTQQLKTWRAKHNGYYDEGDEYYNGRSR